jgi:hypothetical protein
VVSMVTGSSFQQCGQPPSARGRPPGGACGGIRSGPGNRRVRPSRSSGGCGLPPRRAADPHGSQRAGPTGPGVQHVTQDVAHRGSSLPRGRSRNQKFMTGAAKGPAMSIVADGRKVNRRGRTVAVIGTHHLPPRRRAPAVPHHEPCSARHPCHNANGHSDTPSSELWHCTAYPTS